MDVLDLQIPYRYLCRGSNALLLCPCRGAQWKVFQTVCYRTIGSIIRPGILHFTNYSIFRERLEATSARDISTLGADFVILLAHTGISSMVDNNWKEAVSY